MPDFPLPPDAALAEGFRLDGWTVRPRAHELVRGTEVVRVEPKPMEVLVCLAARAGHTVTREELLEAVWPGVFVSESALSRCVSQLRKAFDDDPQAPRVIETIPKAGYRLVAPVVPLAEGDGLLPSYADTHLTMPAPSAARGPAAEPAASGNAASGYTASDTGAPLKRRLRWVGVLGLLLLAVGAIASRLLAPTPDAPLAVVPFDLEPGVTSSAAWDPSGTRVAYVRTTTRAAETGRPTTALLVRAVADTPPLRLDDGTARVATPAWTPDGTAVAYVRCDSLGCAPYAVPALGGPPRRLADIAIAPAGLAWTPDGRALVVGQRAAPDAPYHLARLDLATGSAAPLTAPPATSRGDWMPRISPDGRWLAFERHTAAGGQDLYRLDLAVPTAAPVRLTRDDADIAGATWTPDGRALVLSSNRAGTYALWRLDVDRGTVARVANVPARDPGGPALAGDALVFEEWLFEVNLWRYDLARPDAPPERLVASTLWDMHPSLSPDGRLALVSNRSGAPEVWTAAANGTGLQRLTFFDGPAVESPQWHPDGQRLVVQTRQEERAVLLLLEGAGGPPRSLTTPEADARHPRWSRDGRHVLYASNCDGAWHLWRVSAEGGTPERVPGTEGAIVGAELADGTLLVAQYGAPGLWRLDSARPDADPQPVASDLADPLAWTVAGATVVYVTDTDAGRALVRWEPATGRRAERPLPPLQLMPGAPGMAASRDGQTVVLAQVDQVESDLMRVDGFE